MALRIASRLRYPVICLLLAGCPGERVTIQSSHDASGRLVFAASRQGQRFTDGIVVEVRSCAGLPDRARLAWKIVRSDVATGSTGPDASGNIVYGVVPLGWRQVQPPAKLQEGCFQVALLGRKGESGSLRFDAVTGRGTGTE